jgi:hypothetical protein
MDVQTFLFIHGRESAWDGWLSLEGWVAKSQRDGWLSREGWVAKSVVRQIATAVLWVRIQTSLKNHKWAT